MVQHMAPLVVIANVKAEELLSLSRFIHANYNATNEDKFLCIVKLWGLFRIAEDTKNFFQNE
jgi:hypothetical protein